MKELKNKFVMNIESIKPLKLDSSKQGIWFTSDLHFYHRNIMNYCSRPWKTVEEMNEALINNWNSVVKDDDIVFNLGDFAFASNSKWKEILERLKGKHYLILGNHDVSRYPSDKIMGLFERVEQQMLLKIDEQYVYLNHYPFLCYGGSWKNPEHAVWQLFGHTHSSPNSSGLDDSRLVHLFPYQYDVGVDNNNYTPVSFKQVKDIINSQVEHELKKNKI